MTKDLSRRSFLACMAASPLLMATAKATKVPIGLELYSVRDELKKDLTGTVRAVAKMGYEGVEFYSPYFDWIPSYAKEVRKLLDDLGIQCFSTHNGVRSFEPDNLDKSIELNSIIGSKMIVLAGAGEVKGLDGWKRVAERLNESAVKMKTAGIRAGYHNHDAEFRQVEGELPIRVLAQETAPEVVLQLDVGTCLAAGQDPVAWIESNPGRVNSIHCKDWHSDPARGYEVLLGEGIAPWKRIFEVAEKSGGVEHYLVEQEGSKHPPLDTVKFCLQNFKKLRG